MVTVVVMFCFAAEKKLQDLSETGTCACVNECFVLVVGRMQRRPGGGDLEHGAREL